MFTKTRNSLTSFQLLRFVVLFFCLLWLSFHNRASMCKTQFHIDFLTVPLKVSVSVELDISSSCWQCSHGGLDDYHLTSLRKVPKCLFSMISRQIYGSITSGIMTSLGSVISTRVSCLCVID